MNGIDELAHNNKAATLSNDFELSYSPRNSALHDLERRNGVAYVVGRNGLEKRRAHAKKFNSWYSR